MSDSLQSHELYAARLLCPWDYLVASYMYFQDSSLWSHSVVSDSLLPHGLYSPWNFSGQNPGVGSCFLLQGTFPTQGLNPSLLHCRQILYQLSHQKSPKILEWVAYAFFSWSSWPRNWTAISCTVGGFFISWATREAHTLCSSVI